MMEKINYDDVLLVSCILGDKYKIIYDAPNPSHNCYFFTNNKEEKENIVSKGWNYEYLDFQVSDDEITCSLKAKYVKFLKFLDDYDGKFKRFKHILYFDHKFNIKKEDVENILDISYKAENKYNIITRYHEEPKTLWKEIDDSMYQYKYKKNIGKTITMIQSKIDDGSLKDPENIKVAMTGLIFYNNYDEIIPMLNEIYDSGNLLQQPECQVLWAVFSQKYSDKILVVENDKMKPELLWTYPAYPWIDTTNLPIEYFTSITDSSNNFEITPIDIFFLFISGVFLVFGIFDISRFFRYKGVKRIK